MILLIKSAYSVLNFRWHCGECNALEQPSQAQNPLKLLVMKDNDIHSLSMLPDKGLMKSPPKT